MPFHHVVCSYALAKKLYSTVTNGLDLAQAAVKQLPPLKLDQGLDFACCTHRKAHEQNHRSMPQNLLRICYMLLNKAAIFVERIALSKKNQGGVAF